MNQTIKMVRVREIKILLTFNAASEPKNLGLMWKY
jgi:hypothetical protein